MISRFLNDKNYFNPNAMFIPKAKVNLFVS